ncbi:ABC transporter ATP-binding protein [Azospirillum doebereinerae]|uniref:ATP-binding cassette domain-containing protein n=1 Tax=Azospirillum doebereinerae TaxID=92933 RepID=A0A433JB55_9PROT|nr:ATP-binding cassette domain-containing protein [Azospirillum doebereinerae]RUQ73634.1 ATP-binding cassette domain-containing protein [Azospirillum doebereinerae]
MHRHPPVSDTASAAVVVEDLHKRFGELEVLKGVSLTAREGDVITLIGSSGSGKSTLLRCINMLEIPDEGRIVIGGEAIGLKKARGGRVTVPADTRQVERIRTKLGMVFQSFNLWTHMTILQNVIEAPIHVLGVPRLEAVERARMLLDKVGILAKADSYPVQLSGGQQQRAAIARALAMQPKVMLFDEPTSALDPELVGEVLRVIRQLADEGNTMILVTHEMGFAREVASKVVFLHQGRIEEEGAPDKVLTNPDSDRVRQFLSRHLSGAA